MRPHDLSKVTAIGEAMIELAPETDGRYARAFAGDTFNTLWHLAQLLQGRVRAALLTRVGQDELSDVFIRQLESEGFDTGAITRDPRRTMGLYMIARDGVERRFHYWRSASAARQLAADRDLLDLGLDGARLIHLSGITLAILSPAARQTLFAALGQARAAGARVSFDPNIRPRLWSSPRIMRTTVAQMLTLTDIALPSFDDETRDWGDSTPDAVIARMAQAGVAEIVVKNGGGPVRFRGQGQDGSIDTPPVPDMRDTTGAGDAFNAGYLAARLSGQAPARAVTLGQAVSAAALRNFGARGDRDAVQALGRDLIVTAGPMGRTSE